MVEKELPCANLMRSLFCYPRRFFKDVQECPGLLGVQSAVFAPGHPTSGTESAVTFRRRARRFISRFSKHTNSLSNWCWSRSFVAHIKKKKKKMFGDGEAKMPEIIGFVDICNCCFSANRQLWRAISLLSLRCEGVPLVKGRVDL